MKYKVIILAILAMAQTVFAQNKYERESRIEQEQFPSKSYGLIQEYLQNAKRVRFYQETLWEHSFEVGKVAKLIMKDAKKSKQDIDDAYTAGILHDIGKLIMLREADYYNKVFDFMEKNNSTYEQAEKEIYLASHAEIGAYLLGLWGLPDNIVEAVAFHHLPSESLDREFNILSAVHIANSLISHKYGNINYKNNFEPEDTRLDLNYCQKINSIEQIEKIVQII